MNAVFDRLASLLAPHQCVACGAEGGLLCPACIQFAGNSVEPRCAGCHALSDEFATCKACRSWLGVASSVIAVSYEHVFERLIHEYKFGYKRAAAAQIACIMADASADIDADVVCFVPTAPRRIRERGFDHAQLIAKQYCRIRGISSSYAPLMRRSGSSRQTGAARAERLKQLKGEFYVADPRKVAGKRILLLDDVMTTGASISAAAKALRAAGAKRVDALVFAQKV